MHAFVAGKLKCSERMVGVSPYEETVFVILKPNEADFVSPEQFPVADRIGKPSMGCGIMIRVGRRSKV